MLGRGLTGALNAKILAGGSTGGLTAEAGALSKVGSMGKKATKPNVEAIASKAKEPTKINSSETKVANDKSSGVGAVNEGGGKGGKDGVPAKAAKKTEAEIKLEKKVKEDADSIINTKSKGELRKDAAVSRAIGEGKETERAYTNLKPYKKPSDMDGVDEIEGNQGSFKISNQEAYMNQVKQTYADSGNKLNEQMENRINNYIQSNPNREYNTDGMPGLHAEVQATNDLLNQKVVPSNISVATYKVSPDKYNYQGTEFPACSNCKGILDGFVGNITTGIRD
jgi:hypothetical protein